MKVTLKYDDRGLRDALKQYLDIRRNVDPKKEIRRRAKNISLRLVRIYKQHAAKRTKIRQDVRALGNRVKVRPALRQPGRSRKQQIADEITARQNAVQFTATGWFPAAEKLNAKPRVQSKVRGPKRGSIKEKLNSSKMGITMENSQPGAEVVEKQAKGAVQKAMDQERDDMLKYIDRKQREAARKSGL